MHRVRMSDGRRGRTWLLFVGSAAVGTVFGVVALVLLLQMDRPQSGIPPVNTAPGAGTPGDTAMNPATGQPAGAPPRPMTPPMSGKDTAGVMHGRTQAPGGQRKPASNVQSADTVVEVAGVVEGEGPVRSGDMVDVQLVAQDVETPITSYTLDLRWDTRELDVTEVEGVEGAPKPAATSRGEAGMLTVTGLDAAASRTGDVVLAVLKVRAKGESGAEPRIYVSPRDLVVRSGGGSQRISRGLPRTIPIPIGE